MNQSIFAFYQHMPPLSVAAAMRGGSVTAALASRAEREGVRLDVVAAAGKALEKEGLSIEILDGADIDTVASLPRRLLGELRLGWLVGRRVCRARPRMVLISSPAFLSALVATFFCRISRIAYVLEIRDVYPQVYAHAGLLRESSWIYRMLLSASRGMYTRATRVVVVTKGLDDAVRGVAPSAVVHCEYNGFPAVLRDKRGAKHERFTLCFHGALGFFQDIETLRKLAAAVTDDGIDVVVIGSGRKAELLDDPPPNLRYLGRLSFEDTIGEVAKCHVGLCLRRQDKISQDAFPIKVWEYLGLGMPCVVTPLCEAGRFVEDHACGTQLQAGDVTGLRKAVLLLRDDPAHAQKLATAGEHAVMGFTRERIGERIADIVFSALGEVQAKNR
jgi:glycosyltransferase involved in cell wall biosynthesis